MHLIWYLLHRDNLATSGMYPVIEVDGLGNQWRTALDPMRAMQAAEASKRVLVGSFGSPSGSKIFSPILQWCIGVIRAVRMHGGFPCRAFVTTFSSFRNTFFVSFSILASHSPNDLATICCWMFSARRSESLIFEIRIVLLQFSRALTIFLSSSRSSNHVLPIHHQLLRSYSRQY